MRVSLWWIPRERILELSASDLSILHMCRLRTLFLAAAILYFGVRISGVGVRAARDRLWNQIQSCRRAERPP